MVRENPVRHMEPGLSGFRRPPGTSNSLTLTGTRRSPRNPAMLAILKTSLSAIRRAFHSRTDLVLENAALRQQLDVYQRQVPRPKLGRADRVFWIWLPRHWPRWRSALVIVKAETVLRWHREGYPRAPDSQSMTTTESSASIATENVDSLVARLTHG